MRSAAHTNRPTVLIQNHESAHPAELHITRIGYPRFRWSLMLLGLCLFTFAIVTYRLPVAQLGIAVAALGLFLQSDRIRIPTPLWLFCIFVVWASIASLASPYTDSEFDQLIQSLKLLVVMLVVVNAIRSAGQLRFYLLFFLGCFVLFPTRGTLVNYAVGHHPFGRAVWNYIYTNPNDLAGLSMVALVIALGLIFSEPSRSLVRLGSWASVILLFIVIVLTQSRGAMLGLVVATAPGLIPMLRKRPGILIPIALAAVVVVVAIPEGTWERLSGITKLTSTSTVKQADADGSAAQRLEILGVGWNIFSDHPVLGVGLGAYKSVSAIYAPWLPFGGRMDTHNTYLNLAAEVGLPGLLLWLACFGTVLRYANRCRRLAPPGPLATQHDWIVRALWGYLVAAIFGSYAALTFPYLLLAVLWSSATILSQSSSLQSPNNSPVQAAPVTGR